MNQGPRASRPSTGAARFWFTLAGVFALITLLLVAIGAPSPYLFAGVVAGAICTLSLSSPQKMPSQGRGLALGVIGVQAGSMIDSSVVDGVLKYPAITMGGAVATLAITMGCGQLLRLSPHINGSTATFASIAGGASGLTAMAREMKADEALVVSVQYLRVLVVVLSIPLIAPFMGGASDGTNEAAHDIGWSGVWFTLAALALGLAAARVLTFTASKLLLPMLAAAAFAVTDLFPSHEVPVPITALGFAAIGLMVGLDLTRTVLRRITKVLPLALISLALSIIGCALVGVLLARTTGLSAFSGYLATTPGGLPAVAAFASESGTDIGVIMTAQVLRLFMALGIGAVMAVFIKRQGDESQDAVVKPQ
ncbi:ammonia monooxygenase [Rhodococcus sp. ACPA4]|uniref:AbrB family transcriptional regulator n=1 Tax=Rhodococcus sp. ACPA4 TaxID=2028571 RepID=UPI000BB10504|nr:AbrB family transcriptional regulator [Rhodococcus sp. ACPA4]PBC43762.1 ammonia monooxygenase [Rhodococcus sp. ACPA4]